MNHRHRIWRPLRRPTSRTVLAIAAALAAAPALASVTIDFRGVAFVQVAGPPDQDGTLPLFVQPAGSAYDFGDAAWAGFWGLDAVFGFNLPSGTGGGTFAFVRGADSLYGSFSSVATPTGFVLDYTVSGGTGAWAGWFGTGVGTVTALDPLTLPTVRTSEVGSFTLAVPEPGSAALMLLGGAALAAALRRRRAG